MKLCINRREDIDRYRTDHLTGIEVVRDHTSWLISSWRYSLGRVSVEKWIDHIWWWERLRHSAFDRREYRTPKKCRRWRKDRENEKDHEFFVIQWKHHYISSEWLLMEMRYTRRRRWEDRFWRFCWSLFLCVYFLWSLCVSARQICDYCF